MKVGLNREELLCQSQWIVGGLLDCHLVDVNPVMLNCLGFYHVLSIDLQLTCALFAEAVFQMVYVNLICSRLHLEMLLLLSTPLHQCATSRVQHPNHVAANSLSPQVARKGSTLSGFVQRSRLEREVGRDLHSNKWEEV